MLNRLVKINCALDMFSHASSTADERRKTCLAKKLHLFVYLLIACLYETENLFYYESINKQMMQWRRPTWSLALHFARRAGECVIAPPPRVWTVFDLLLAYRDKILSTNSIFFGEIYLVWEAIRSARLQNLTRPSDRRVYRSKKWLWVGGLCNLSIAERRLKGN